MTTVHPSRARLVPQERDDGGSSASPGPSVDREQELKRRLQARTKEKSGGNVSSAEGSPRPEPTPHALPEKPRALSIRGSAQRKQRAGPHDTYRPRSDSDSDGERRPGRVAISERREGASPDRRDRLERPPHLDMPERQGRSDTLDRSDPRRPSPTREDYIPLPPPRGDPLRLGFDDQPPPLGLPPWRPNEHPGPGRPHDGGARLHDRNGHGRPPFRDNRERMNLEERRQVRERTEVNIWPPSPKRSHAEELALQQDPKSKGKRSRRKSRRYASDSDDSEEEYERRRRERRRREKEQRRRGDSEARSERKRSESRYSDRRSRSRAVSERWEEKSERSRSTRPPSLSASPEDLGPEVGPQIPSDPSTRLDRDAFRALLPGEGEAMSSFAAKGERIPRRGEIGLDQRKIAQYEDSGFVMSGSRHVRMNAVRMRKEGQVLSAVEKAALYKMQREQQQMKEGAIISQFKEMMDERLLLEEKRTRDEKREEEEERVERERERGERKRKR